MAMNFSQESMGAPYGGLGGLGGGLGGVGLVGLIGLNSFLGNRGLGFDGGYGPNQGGAAAIVTDKNVADIRQEIGALGNEIQSSLANQTLGQTMAFANLNDRLCASEKAAMQMGFDLQTQGMTNTQMLANKVDANTMLLSGQIGQFQSKVDSQFCEVQNAIKDSTQIILNQLCADKLDEKNEIIDQLRAERAQLTQTLQFSNQFTAINSAIADLSQNQRLTNQVIQFGAGNLAGQAATNNQVR